MVLTAENYHSLEANVEFLSVSQFKDFAGCTGKRGCEAYALAKVRGEWKEEPNEAMLIGSYVDAHVEGTLDLFKASHDCYKKSGKGAGELYAWCQKAEQMIQRFERDPVFMGFLTGKKQVILTAELFGAMWKIKIDNLGLDFITDLKTARSLTESSWSHDTGRISFVEDWGYDIQGAIYPAVVQKVIGGERLPMYFAAVSKEEYPDINVIQLDNTLIRDALYNVERNTERIVLLKKGEIIPDRCELCNYCRSTKVLSKPVMASNLVIA